jgi:long-chain acyl-CoA synthetase
LAHILQRVVDLVAILGQGQIAYCSDIDQVQEKLREVRPHLLVGVPRTYEKIQHTIMENLFYSGPPVKEIYQRVFRWMELQHAGESKGRKKGSVMDRPLNWVKKSAENKVRDRLGGRIRSFFVAGAPLPRDLETFFEIIRIPLFNVYGMTETTGAITANCPDRYRPGTAGLPLPGVEVRIQEDGEILVRGDTVMAGYFQAGKPTEKGVNAEGWFSTGDLGTMDEQGFLTITGRKKEILITAAGKNIAPQHIERRLRLNPFIRQAMVLGDGRRYLSALIVPSFPKLNEYALKQRILYLNHEELLEHPRILKLYEETIREVNKDLSRFETLKKFCLLTEPFTPETGEITPTQRLRRKEIEKRYRDEIDRMYWGSD